MFQPRHIKTAIALAACLLLIGCGGASSGTDEFFEAFDSGSNGGSIGPAPLVITTTTLPAGKPGVSYPTTTLAVQGTQGTVTWRVAEGTLPSGLWLTTDGRLVGTPGEAGFFEFTAEARTETVAAAQELALAIDTFGVRITDGLHFGEAWSGRVVTLRSAGQTGTVVFSAAANRSGGRFHEINASAGTATWIPGNNPGMDVLQVTDSANGAVADVEVDVVRDPTAGHMAEFGGNDVWFIDSNLKRGAHPYATDLRAALARLGLRSQLGTGSTETEADRLAELVVQIEILREVNSHFLRERDGTAGTQGLPISFAFERPGAGYVSPAGGTTITGRPNGYSVMALCDQSGGLSSVGTAFADSPGNTNHEHNAPGGSYGELGVFVNFISEAVQNNFRLYGSDLRDMPVHGGDIAALKAILHNQPSPGGRYDMLHYTVRSLAKCIGSTVAHEVGHSLGLGHQSSYTAGAIMNSSAIFHPGMDHHFTADNLQVLRAGLPGPGRGSLQALKIAGGAAAVVAQAAPSHLHVCGCGDQQ